MCNSINKKYNNRLKFLLLIFLLIPVCTALAQNNKPATGQSFQGFIKNIPLIKASKLVPHPDWAIMQRQLMKTIEQSAPGYVKKFTQKDGTPYGLGPYDDVYEMFYN